ncbi:hypothetical protein MM236_11550 [Belliella sp. DSM 107340]|uniref:Glycosyl transferase family 2 n=1 Tax=Belliella calami TaxID=2923436 RepID=A0ABS9UPS4_9BACT|nr:hypothetical protein [Belliella calami]MCH7398631.1 hypothetical protein [Belliella calami]
MEEIQVNQKLAPVVLFVYNRLEESRRTVETLRRNHLASASNLYIYSDGAKKEKDIAKVESVRNYINTIDGFKSVKIKESPKNKGLAKSIIDGVTEVINIHGSVIVLEDDLVSSENFLDFVNSGLRYYEKFDEVISISGYSPNLKSLKTHNKDYYLTERISSLGWGTWKSKWENIDWEVSDYNDFKDDFFKKYKWFKIGSDLPGMLKNQMNGKINSWAIRWSYHQFKHEMLTVYASKSKVNHIGDGEEATNAKDHDRFFTHLDLSNQREFEFDEKLEINKKLREEFRNNYSISKRLKYKIKALFKK